MAKWFGFMRGNVMVMTACECVWRSTIDIIWPFLSLYVLELGGSYETIGLIMAVGSLASLVFYPLGGYIADYQGRIKLIAYMTFTYGAAFLIPGAARARPSCRGTKRGCRSSRSRRGKHRGPPRSGSARLAGRSAPEPCGR